MGVRIEKGSEIHVIHAPIIISTAGLYNTFLKLLPEPVAKNSYFYKVITHFNCQTLQHFPQTAARTCSKELILLQGNDK